MSAETVDDLDRDETQQDRCSDQRHLWRWSRLLGFDHMACSCGAVHPDDLDAFMARPSQAPAAAS